MQRPKKPIKGFLNCALEVPLDSPVTSAEGSDAEAGTANADDWANTPAGGGGRRSNPTVPESTQTVELEAVLMYLEGIFRILLLTL